MAKYIICEKCGKLIEYNPEYKYEGGTSYTTLKCPECGHELTFEGGCNTCKNCGYSKCD